MARTTTKPRTHVQQAVIDLRAALGGITQQELAVRMGKAVVTIARWETSRPPSGPELFGLCGFALAEGLPGIALDFLTPRVTQTLDESIALLNSVILGHMSHEMLQEILPRLERLAVVAEDIRVLLVADWSLRKLQLLGHS
jgi:transcriptional regulator with XRE-family HTH domain